MYQTLSDESECVGKVISKVISIVSNTFLF